MPFLGKVHSIKDSPVRMNKVTNAITRKHHRNHSHETAKHPLPLGLPPQMNHNTTRAAIPPCRQSTARRVVRGVARRRTGLSVGAAAPDDFPVRQGRPLAPYPPPSKATSEGFQRASGKPFGAPAGASPSPAAVRRPVQQKPPARKPPEGLQGQSKPLPAHRGGSPVPPFA